MKLRSFVFIVVAAGVAAVTEPASAATIHTTAARTVIAPAMEVDDAEVAERVAEELAAVLGDHAGDVGVHVDDGNVMLTGYVGTEAERRRVHDAVWSVAGVRGLRIDRFYASTARRRAHRY
jgi:osmotically-inducible protein OsmY